MGFIILSFFIAVTSAGYLWLFSDSNKKKYNALHSFLVQKISTIIGFAALIGMFLGTMATIYLPISAMIFRPHDIEFRGQYNAIKTETSIYSSLSTKDAESYVSSLNDDIDEINYIIDKNKKYSGNFWFGIFYNKKVGDYRKIEKINIDNFYKEN